jgi:hypothetical protein
MIKKIKGKYVVLSETTGRKFGTYSTKSDAERRLRQVEYFKYAKTGKAGKTKKVVGRGHAKK